MSNEEIVTRIQSNPEDRLNLLGELYEQNRGLIAKIANRYVGTTDIDDLMQEGYLGLEKAVEMYDAGAETSFASYAYGWIRQRISYYARKNITGVTIPAERITVIHRYERIMNAARIEGRIPSDRELLGELKLLDYDELEQLRKDFQAIHCVSMDAPLSDKNASATFGDILPTKTDPYEESINSVFNQELSAELWPAVNILPGIEALVIRERYQNGKTFTAISQEQNIPYSQVIAAHNKALQALRRPTNRRKFRPYLTEEQARIQGLKGTGLNAFVTQQESSTERAALFGCMKDRQDLKKLAQSVTSEREFYDQYEYFETIDLDVIAN